MKSHTFTSSCLLLLLAAPAWGQSPLPTAGGEARRPLNLSLPREFMSPPVTVIRNETEEDAAVRNLKHEEQGSAKRNARQPYGTGYEARQRSMTMESAGPGFGAGGSGMAGGAAGGAGMAGGGGGGSGGGGMGRGR